MQLRGASRSSRAVLAVFLAVAIVSSALLGGLGWKLLQQDRELQKTRTGERIAAAANALAVCQPPGAICLTISKSQVSVDAGAILYYPYDPQPQREAPTELFEKGEHFEYQPGGLQALLDGAAISIAHQRSPRTAGTSLIPHSSTSLRQG